MVIAARRSRTLLALVAAALAAGAGEASAQAGRTDAATIRIMGRVQDVTTGDPVPEARVWLMTGGAAQARIVWSGVADKRGVWTSAPLAVGPMDLHVEAFGYRTAAAPLEAFEGMEVSVRVDLVPEPLEMEPLVVVSSRRSRLDTSGFNERRRQGQGSSITRSDCS